MDAQGFLTIIGRKKEIIINSAGKNIAPARLENLIKQNGLIAHACVVGDARKFITVVLALDADVALAWAETNDIDGGLVECAQHQPGASR